MTGHKIEIKPIKYNRIIPSCLAPSSVKLLPYIADTQSVISLVIHNNVTKNANINKNPLNAIICFFIFR